MKRELDSLQHAISSAPAAIRETYLYKAAQEVLGRYKTHVAISVADYNEIVKNANLRFEARPEPSRLEIAAMIYCSIRPGFDEQSDLHFEGRKNLMRRSFSEADLFIAEAAKGKA